MAAESDLDLVEVAPQAKPPVCKLMDFGKYKYEAAVKAREARKNQTNTVLKEIRFRLKIDTHDYETKRGHALRFLGAGDKVKAMIQFRGREQQRPEMGIRLLQRFAEDVAEVGVVESSPRIDGRNMVMVVGPLKNKAEAKAEARRATQRAEAKAENEAKAAGRVDISGDEQGTPDAVAGRPSAGRLPAFPRRPPLTRRRQRRKLRQRAEAAAAGSRRRSAPVPVEAARLPRPRPRKHPRLPVQRLRPAEAPKAGSAQGRQAGSSAAQQPRRQPPRPPGRQRPQHRRRQHLRSRRRLWLSRPLRQRRSRQLPRPRPSRWRGLRRRSLLHGPQRPGPGQAGGQEDQLVHDCGRQSPGSQQPARRPQGRLHDRTADIVRGYVRRSVPMPKMKTHSGAKKRFKLTGSGKLRRQQANRRHYLEHKSSALTRRLAGDKIVFKGDAKVIRKMLGI